MAAGAAEIIESDDLEAGIVVEQPVRDTAPSETADSREQDFHCTGPILSILSGSVANGFAAAHIAFVDKGYDLNLNPGILRQGRYSHRRTRGRLILKIG